MFFFRHSHVRKLYGYICELSKIDWINTLRFNFAYFDFKIATRLPILLYNSYLSKIGGSITLQENPRFGMIKLGKSRVPIFNPRKSFIFSNEGGHIYLSSCVIGSGTCITVKKDAILNIGEGLSATYGLTLTCNKHITIGKSCTFGWNVEINDDEFGYIVKNAQINIGDYVWIANGATLNGNCTLSNFSIVAAQSNIKGCYEKDCSLIVGNPSRVAKTGVTMDLYSEYANQINS